MPHFHSRAHIRVLAPQERDTSFGNGTSLHVFIIQNWDKGDRYLVSFGGLQESTELIRRDDEKKWSKNV